MKKQYNQPTVNVESLHMDSNILLGASPAGGNVMTFQAAISTEDQW